MGERLPKPQDIERPAERTLESGLSRSEPFEVGGRLVTDVGGSIDTPVLSTPGMIAMMERTAALLALEHLPEGKATVGFEVCIKHVGGVGEGAAAQALATLTEIADDRKLRFDVEVTSDGRTIGVGTHERRIIDVGGGA
ncbi:MAG: thioesterase family protein [Solirubrobacterales bacterium]